MLFGNIISTKLGWLICTFPSQLSIFCMLHVILHFHMGKGIHDPNDPLHFSCMLGFLGCEMCLFQKLYVEGFVDSHYKKNVYQRPRIFDGPKKPSQKILFVMAKQSPRKYLVKCKIFVTNKESCRNYVLQSSQILIFWREIFPPYYLRGTIKNLSQKVYYL